MKKEDMELIVKKWYDGLAEGKLLGRKCKECGHVEFPPFLVCNDCGCFDTEWVEVDGKAHAVEFIPQSIMQSNAALNERYGNFLWALVKLDGADVLDTMNTLVLGVGPERLEELQAKLPVAVRPKIVEMDGWSELFWELDE